MTRIGIVNTTHGQRAQVDTTKRGLCGNCSHGGACTLGLGEASQRHEVVEADNALGARPGDTVELELPGHSELKVSLLVWVLPMVGLVLGTVLGMLTGRATPLGEDPGAALGAVLGFALTIAALRLLDRRVRDDHRLRLQIVRVIEGPASCPDHHGS